VKKDQAKEERALSVLSADELAQLDEATKRAEADINAMIEALDANAEDHKVFMAHIAKLRQSDSDPS
jgi:hypothetical protein